MIIIFSSPIGALLSSKLMDERVENEFFLAYFSWLNAILPIFSFRSLKSTDHRRGEIEQYSNCTNFT